MVRRLRLCTPNAGGLGSIPGQGTRSHMPQLKISHVATKVPSPTAKMGCRQINIKKNRRRERLQQLAAGVGAGGADHAAARGSGRLGRALTRSRPRSFLNFWEGLVSPKEQFIGEVWRSDSRKNNPS